MTRRLRTTGAGDGSGAETELRPFAGPRSFGGSAEAKQPGPQRFDFNVRLLLLLPFVE